jgi:hypothetical protein
MAYKSPKDLANSIRQRRKARAADDGYVRETFTCRAKRRGLRRGFGSIAGPLRLICPKSNGGGSCPAIGSSSGCGVYARRIEPLSLPILG